MSQFFEGELRNKVLAILAEALDEERYPEAVAEMTLSKIELVVAVANEPKAHLLVL